MRLTEFYPELQGRPDSKTVLDMETRGPSIPPGYITGIMLKASYSTAAPSESYTASDRTVILADGGSGGIMITLPSASTNNGKYYHIKKIDAGSGTITIQGNVSTETIDGETSVKLKTQYSYLTVLCNGSVWYILGGEYVKMEDLLEELLGEANTILRLLLSETRQNKMHLGSMSDADVDEGADTED